MSNEIVGVENVPNVYISKINLSDNSSKLFNISVNLELFDKTTQGQYLWSTYSMFTNFLKIGVIITSNNRLNELLKNGTISPLPGKVKKSKFYDKNTVLKEMSLKEFNISVTGDTKKFHGKHTSTVNMEIKNCFVYAYAYIDTTQVSKTLSIDMSGHLKDYCGPMKSEIILKNHVVQRTTSLFLKSDNTPWPGAVHLHNGVYMGGPVHSTSPHPVLRKITIENLKILDNRTRKFSRSQQGPNQKTPFIGKLYHSVNSKTNLNGVFAVNMKQLIMMRIKNAKTAATLSPKMFQEMSTFVTINFIAVVRQQVRSARGANKLGTIKLGKSKIHSYNYVATSREESFDVLKNTETLQQIYLNNNSNIRYYQFTDNKVSSKTSGDYKYKLVLNIKDRTQVFIDSVLQDLKSGYNDLKNSIQMLNRINNYDYNSKKLKTDTEVPDTILSSIQTYYDSLSYFKKISQNEINQMINNKMLLFMKSNYEPSSANLFLAEYESLLVSFSRKFKDSPPSISLKRPKTVKTAFTPGSIQIEKTWENTINFTEFRRSYDYLGIKDNNNVATISLEALARRGSQEVNRLFDTSKPLSDSEISRLPTGVQKGLKDVETNRLKFLAPLSFSVDNKETDISDPSTVNMQSLTSDFLKAQEDKNRIITPSKAILKKRTKVKRKANKKLSKRKNRRRRRPGKFRFKVTTKMIPKTLAELKNLDPLNKSSEYLGDNSEFINSLEETSKTISIQSLEVIENLIQSAVNVQTDRNKENYDLGAPNNFMDDMKNLPSFKSSQITSTPNHFKALMTSKTEAARNNILSEEDDVLKSPSSKVLMEMTFQVTQRLEMMSGFFKDNSGNDIINEPRWIPLDTSLLGEGTNVICRMTYTEIPEIGFKPSEDFKMAVINSIFIIEGADLFNKQSPSDDQSILADFKFDSKNEMSSNMVYARTNIIKQNMSGFNYTTGRSTATATMTMTTPASTTMSRGGSY